MQNDVLMMQNEVFMNNNSAAERKENVLAGIVGAFLFSLAGGAVWVLLSFLNFYAGFSGLIGVVCAVQGYKIFSGKLTKRGVVISFVTALLVLVIAWYCCFAKDIYFAFKDWYAAGEVNYLPTYLQCLSSGFVFLGNAEIAVPYFGSLLMGLLFAVIGSISYFLTTFRNAGSSRKNAAHSSIPSEVTDSGPANTLSDDPLSENTLSENAIRENAISENAIRENAIRENAISENAIRESTAFYGFSDSSGDASDAAEAREYAGDAAEVNSSEPVNEGSSGEFADVESFFKKNDPQ